MSLPQIIMTDLRNECWYSFAVGLNRETWLRSKASSDHPLSRSIGFVPLSGVLKYATGFPTTFALRSARRLDSLLIAIAMIDKLHWEGQRALPERVPTGYLISPTERKFVFGQQKPDRRLYEIATLAALRERLRSADIWAGLRHLAGRRLRLFRRPRPDESRAFPADRRSCRICERMNCSPARGAAAQAAAACRARRTHDPSVSNHLSLRNLSPPPLGSPAVPRQL